LENSVSVSIFEDFARILKISGVIGSDKANVSKTVSAATRTVGSDKYF
jgi:hypothetical protein